jgi:hypothetical protein
MISLAVAATTTLLDVRRLTRVAVAGSVFFFATSVAATKSITTGGVEVEVVILSRSILLFAVL